MEDNNSTITNDITYISCITLILLIIVEIPSIVCTLLILIYTIFHWHSMVIKAHFHHAILLLIIVSFLYITLDLPFTISYYHLGYDYFRTPLFCLWWYWIDYTILATSLLLTATASIQRHILIFNSHLLRTRWKRWLIHFLPLILCILYPSFFYIGFIYIYPCPNLFDNESLSCPYPCYSDNIISYNIDWMINYISPMIIIILANSILIVRVIYSRKRVQTNPLHTWKKRRKLTLQLFSISLIYVLGWIPALVVSIIQTYFVPNLFNINPQLYYISNSCYFVCPLQSFVCIFALPELLEFIKNNIKRIFMKKRVIPVIVILPPH